MIQDLNRRFKIIPVLDLKDGIVVRGIRGERAKYQAVISQLTASSEFSDVLGALHKGFGFTEYYIADLDALSSDGEKNQLRLIAQSIKTKGAPLSFMLDAGIREVADVAKVLETGVEKVIIGTETMPSLETLREIIRTFGSNCLVVSIDTNGSKVLSLSPQIAKWTPPEAIREIHKTGIREFILLQLARVGTGDGLDKALIQECLTVLAQNNSSSGALIVGGGISGYEDLRWLADNGLEGALVASVLHDGRLDPETVQALQDGRQYNRQQY